MALPAIGAVLVPIISWAIGSLIARFLIALFAGFTVYYVGENLLNNVLSFFADNYTAYQGYTMLNLAGVGEGFSIISGALIARATIRTFVWGLK